MRPKILNIIVNPDSETGSLSGYIVSQQDIVNMEMPTGKYSDLEMSRFFFHPGFKADVYLTNGQVFELEKTTNKQWSFQEKITSPHKAHGGCNHTISLVLELILLAAREDINPYIETYLKN